MLLAIDVGNTETSWASSKARSLAQLADLHPGGADRRRAGPAVRRVPVELDVAFESQVTGGGGGLRRAGREPRRCGRWSVAVLPLLPGDRRAGIEDGRSVVTDNPREVGADQDVNALAAFSRFGGPAIVVDFGTATKYDAVSDKGEFSAG